MSETLQGRRLPDMGESDIPATMYDAIQRGDYVWAPNVGRWMFRDPVGTLASISPSIHQITEHEDGSITVSPSIQVHGQSQWHGYLERGVWRTA
jgi:hypothetical protein